VLAFVAVALIELVVILQVGQVIGTWPTVVLLVADSIFGAWLLKREGRKAWQQFRSALDQMRWPGDEVAQGALVIVGGTLLLTPGFVTDIAGFLLLLAPTRRILARQVRKRFRLLDVGAGPGAARGRRSSGPSGEILDVEVVEIERDGPDRDRPGRDGGPDGRGPDGRERPGRDLPPGQI